MEFTGWLLDVYADPDDGVALWLLDEQDGSRRRLRQALPISFHAAGPAPRLRQLWHYLRRQPVAVMLSRSQRRDLFCEQPLTVLTVQVSRPAAQPGLFQQVSKAFPDLTYYDADLPLSLHHAARYGTFPLARCRVDMDEAGWVSALEPLDSPWDLDPAPPPLRALSLEPDVDPSHAEPRHLLVRSERGCYRLSLQPARPLLVNLRAILKRHNPDLLLTTWGDTWLLPYLLELSERYNLPLPLNRDPACKPVYRPERTYFAYGQVIYRGRQVYLFGRWHVDGHNAVLYHDYGMEGVFELARVTGLPVQSVARLSPGSGISAMQMLTALREGVLVPWHKQQAERPKTALELLRADQGGLVYQPVIGLHKDVAEIDFVSMYPSIMARFNISPETVGEPHPPGPLSETERGEKTEIWMFGSALPTQTSKFPIDSPSPLRGKGPGDRGVCPRTETEEGISEVEVLTGAERPQSPKFDDFAQEGWGEPGLVPKTLQPLLDKRIALKLRLAELPAWNPRRRAYKARTLAHKWLLVTCFGYLGYKNARFGRIEAHEAVTAYGRETLLRAKEAAEDLGYTVLHMYVDGMWVQKAGKNQVPDFQPLLDEIAARTSLSIALDGVYRWVAFLPSRLDGRVPVPNRYFGVFQDGSLKMRGIEARRQDTPPWIAQVQLGLLDCLAQAGSIDEVPDCLPGLKRLLRKASADLRRGRVPLAGLLVSQKLSRELDEYRVPSPAARAAAQLEAVGKHLRPGQRVRFLYTLGEPGVRAWDLPDSPDPATVDRRYYQRLLQRAIETVLQPFGLRIASLMGELEQMSVT
jgi:DNA polymerase elongation subunit (family B)